MSEEIIQDRFAPMPRFVFHDDGVLEIIEDYTTDHYTVDIDSNICFNQHTRLQAEVKKSFCDITYEDKRMQAAKEVYQGIEQSGDKIALVNKTTRAGCTTSLTSAAIHQEKKVLVIEPTNKIIDETIVSGIQKYGGCDQIGLTGESIKIIKILPNSKCAYNQILIREVPELKKLPTLPLYKKCSDCESMASQCIMDLRLKDAKKIYISSPCRTCVSREIPDCKNCKLDIPEGCRECKYKDCSAYARCHVSDIFKYRDEADGYAITSKKLATVMQQYMAPRPEWADYEKPADIIFEVLSNCDVVIYDEIHMLHRLNQSQITLDDSSSDINCYEKISGEIYPYTKAVIQRFGQKIVDPEVKKAVERALEKARSDDYHEKHISERVDKTFSTEIGGVSTAKLMGALMWEIIHMVKSGDYSKVYGLTIKQVSKIYQMADIAVSPAHTVGVIRSGEDLTTILTASHEGDVEALNSFAKAVQANENLVVLTSATVDETYPYLEKMRLSEQKIHHTTFGFGGDPLLTNQKQLIFAARRKMSVSRGMESLISEKDEICAQISQIDHIFGRQNNLVVAANIETAKAYEEELERSVTWFNADNTIGVKSSCRVATIIGEAWKPANTYDTITKNEHESKVMLEFSRHADTSQAIARVKDPEGNEPSVVFAFGAVKRDLQNDMSWGNHRQIHYAKPEKQGESAKVEITHDGDITMPAVDEYKVFDELLFRGYFWQDQNYGLSLMKMRPEQQCNIFCADNPCKVPNYTNLYVGTFHGVSAQELLKSDVWYGVSKLALELGLKVEYPAESLKLPKVPVFFRGDVLRKAQHSISLIEILQLMKPKITSEEIIRYATGEDGILIETTDDSGICKFVRFGAVDSAYANRLCEYLYLRGIPCVLGVEPDGVFSVFVLTPKAFGATAKQWAKDVMTASGMYDSDHKVWRAVVYPNRVTHRRGTANEQIAIMPGTRFYIFGARHLTSVEDLQVNIEDKLILIGDDVPVVVRYRNPTIKIPELYTEEELMAMWIECSPDTSNIPDIEVDDTEQMVFEAAGWDDYYYDYHRGLAAIQKAIDLDQAMMDWDYVMWQAIILNDTTLPEVKYVLEAEAEAQAEYVEEIPEDPLAKEIAEADEKAQIVAEDTKEKQDACLELYAKLEKQVNDRLQKYLRSRGLLGNPIPTGNTCLRPELRIQNEEKKTEKQAAAQAKKSMKALEKASKKAKRSNRKCKNENREC